MAYSNSIYITFAFLGFAMSMIPLPWHLEAWNTGTCLYMIWTGLSCLNFGINAIVWNKDAIVRAPVWCDISTRFLVGASVAIPAASLCINRRLYHISTANTVTITRAEKRRAIMVDLAIGVGIPILEMILQYIPQGHRFNIYEEVGCYPFTYNTWVAYVLVSSWPVAIGLVSIYYCVRSIIAFNQRRTQFKQLLSGNSNLNANRYWRLMSLAAVEILLTVPFGVYGMYVDATAVHVSPWISFADTHFGFSRIDSIPTIIWRATSLGEFSIEVTRWAPIMCAIIFFAFFGFADEARKNYKAMYGSVAKKLGVTTFGSETNASSKGFGTSSNGRSGHLPVFVSKETSRKRDSLDSFTNFSTSDVDFKENSFNEKSFNGNVSFGAISLNDVGGALADDNEIVESPSDTIAPAFPEPAVTRDELTIEVSSVRYPSMISATIPSPTLTVGTVPKHPIDAPLAVGSSQSQVEHLV
ncbi:putative pheromone receptor [Dendrothele bispora CBS 962.96]|uniref:Putative pheromone receptor n=1 Tax=Dendrothele bispora (strain CBS 962.96) TaxID=1314807 RepID=A0A4S8ME86_DENBC|nr:putative pheromone receptor [Dendrothele bispora CBS 962.96]